MSYQKLFSDIESYSSLDSSLDSKSLSRFFDDLDSVSSLNSDTTKTSMTTLKTNLPLSDTLPSKDSTHSVSYKKLKRFQKKISPKQLSKKKANQK